MDYILVGIVALLGSGLTFFSGFGLGTLLMPVFALFFPIDIAIALTAIVHLLNNLFKLTLVGKKASTRTVLRFGLPAIVFALLGAYVLGTLTDIKPIYSYTLYNKLHEITVVKICIAALLTFFSLFDLIPKLKRLEIDTKYLPIGGALSGFFGGISGHQGALRTAFLIRAKLSKETFIATGVVIACFIDISRISIYAKDIFKLGNQLNYKLLITAILMAFIGAYIGKLFLKKITINTIQVTVGFLLIIFSLLLGLGIL
ncbi:sulfite exporter TauE/SafE family protein [Aquimarina sp. AD10]|uniref:sulfite exporter TauE/SafE family protein n=1 Tax=Aquimarina sp. AD10 TaxID=1714849 RepID=UPI000E476225|nr:sulfite exporter TauE/SafE family protein [Aquimarina sp. AD10]AXT63416.1 sulfite exporter TauE/SafE family protein [Aquimarina sp. AD10]RKN00571.1 sulfite exporter TauE/SafE family protein [Aquimarina sp. AD10]